MTNKHRQICAALSALAALVLSSCINVEQDIWINKDGSGRVVIDMGITKEAAGMMQGLAGGLAEGLGGAAGAAEVSGNPFDIDPEKEQKKLLKNQYITSAKVEKTEDDKYTHFIYTLDISDITKLEEVQKDALSDGPMGGDSGGPSPEGEFSVVKTDAGTYKIAAELKGEGAGGPEGGEEIDAFAAGMMKQMLGDAAFTFRVHATPVDHNGTEKDGAVVWTLPLADMAAGKSMSITGEFKPAGSPGGGGLTFWLVLGAVIVLAGVLFFVFQSQKPKLA